MARYGLFWHVNAKILNGRITFYAEQLYFFFIFFVFSRVTRETQKGLLLLRMKFSPCSTNWWYFLFKEYLQNNGHYIADFRKEDFFSNKLVQKIMWLLSMQIKYSLIDFASIKRILWFLARLILHRVVCQNQSNKLVQSFSIDFTELKANNCLWIAKKNPYLRQFIWFRFKTWNHSCVEKYCFVNATRIKTLFNVYLLAKLYHKIQFNRINCLYNFPTKISCVKGNLKCHFCSKPPREIARIITTLSS